MIELRILGTVDIRGAEGGQPQSVLAQPKRLAVLAYLAAAVPFGLHRRDRLLGLLWPELDDARARNALNKTVHHIRRALGEDALVSRSDDEIGIDPARLDCDVVAFVRASDERRHADALIHYRGDLLEGFFVSDAAGFERWLEDRRSALRRRAAECARALARESAVAGRLEDLRRYAERGVALAGADEGALRELITLFDKAGDRAGALHAYEEFARRLVADYGSEPSPETRALVATIRMRSAPADANPGVGVGIHTAVAQESTAVATPAARNVERRVSARAQHVSLVALAALLVVAAVWGGSRLRREPLAAVPLPVASVAVLRFLDLSADTSSRYVADGMTEELIDALAHVERLRVAARTSTFRFRDAAPIDSIGRELQVANVVEGSIRVVGGRIRVTAQLIDVASGYHRWSQSYDRNLTDVLGVEEDIAREIVSALAIRLAPAEQHALAARPTRDPMAYDLYLRGRYLWRQRSDSALTGAVVAFQRAIARDSSFALAWIGLADAYAVLPGYSAVPASEAFPRARAALARALELDSTSAEAHVSLAGLMQGDWDWQGARRHFARAVKLVPGNASAHQWYGETLIILGHTDEAIAEMQRAMQLDHGSAVVASNLGWFLLTAKRYGEAESQFGKAIAINPRFAHAYDGLGSTYREMGRLDEAIDTLRRADALSRSNPTAKGYLGHALAIAGRRDDARRVRESVRAPNGKGPPSAWAIAVIDAGLAERDSALAWLEVAYRQREQGMSFLAIDPVFVRLHDDVRFQALLIKMGLAEPTATDRRHD